MQVTVMDTDNADNTIAKWRFQMLFVTNQPVCLMTHIYELQVLLKDNTARGAKLTYLQL